MGQLDAAIIAEATARESADDALPQDPAEWLASLGGTAELDDDVVMDAED